ncbi:AAA family ATPase [Coleofasciculus sp. F4-SAH-05]|uniref:AAA family ATPase n=1 Tax=Coleofasciculus sp. F4-SAH-05 TaxID=3069525 RepID=UPI0032FA4809
MHIDELHIQNFRCFQEIHFRFPPDNTAILIGVNGSGKTSALDCIAILLNSIKEKIINIEYGEEYSILGEGQPGIFEKEVKKIFTLNDIKVNEQSQALPVNVSVLFSTKNHGSISWSITENIYYHKTIDNIGKGKQQKEQELNRYIDKLNEKINSNLLYSNLPLLVYYRTHRMFLNAELVNEQYTNDLHIINQLNAYQGSFNPGINNFQDFLIWFKQEEDYENEIRVRQDNAYRKPNLEVIRKAIKIFLEGFTDSYFHNLRVVRSKSQGTLKLSRRPAQFFFIITKNNQNLKLEQLSDGEKMLLMLVTDLARRFAIANPGLGVNALEGEGIVLIDEIDLHLHPQWQRIVIPSLTRTFPNCQFIVTTHSPQVLSNVKRENVFILEDYQLIEVTPHTYGRDSNSILYELMGVKERPNQVQDKINACFALIDEDKIEDAKIKLQELAELLGENDPEVVRGQTLISFLTD